MMVEDNNSFSSKNLNKTPDLCTILRLQSTTTKDISRKPSYKERIAVEAKRNGLLKSADFRPCSQIKC